MIYPSLTSYGNVAPNPISYGLVRCWIPGIGVTSNRALRNLCYTGGGPQNDSTNGSELMLGTGVNCTAGAGPKLYSMAINGLPALSFDGTDDTARCRYSANPVIPEVASATYCSYALAFRRKQTAQNGLQFGFSETATTQLRIDINGFNNYIYFRFHDTGGNPRHGYFVCGDLKWHLVVFAYDGSQSTDSTKLQCYLDGTPQILSFSATALPSTTPAVAGSFWIGFDDIVNSSRPGEFAFGGVWNRHLKQSDAVYLYNEFIKGYPTFLRNSSVNRSVGYGIVSSSTPKGRVFKSPVIAGTSFI